MRPKQAFVLISVPLACYLIFSLSLVSAYRMGELQDAGVKFIIEPVIRIVDDLKPINCESSGYVTFHAYVENVPEFDIKGSEAFVEDVSGEETYNVTSALSCFPKTDLISNQEITCTLNVRELLWNIQSCPFEKPENRFYLTLEISYGNRNVKISNEKDFVLTGPGTEPDLEIDFDVSTPSYAIPEINCRTGSEIEVPVVIKHAETLYGDITWSFSVDETGYGGNLIECEKILSREGEGREDIYICALVISNTVFPECDEGSEVLVGIRAGTIDHDLPGSFSTSLVSEELNLGLQVSEIGTIECQIIDEEGTCVPREPQQNVTARITGNVPARLKVFEYRYRLGDQNITTTYCRKISHEKYECLAFITIDQLPMPADEHSKTTKSRELTLFFDVKYMNYYTSLSNSITVTLEGSVINEILNTVNVLEKDKDFFEAIKKISDALNTAYRWVNTISQCCLLGDILEQLKEGSTKEALREVAEMYLFGDAKTKFGKMVAVLVGNGPALVSCISEKAMGDIDKEIGNLEDFEEGSITSPLDMPSFGTVLAQYYPSCRAENFWDQIKSSWKGWLCAVIFWITPIGGAICPILTNPVVSAIFSAINLLLMVISLLLLLNTYNEAFKNIALARERINLQLAAENAVGNITMDYSEALANTMEALATGLATNTALLNLTYPSYDTIKLLFISDRTGVLDNEDEICVGDSVTIEYNFEKLSQTEGFVSKLSINPNRRGPLLFDDLEGTYGPIETNTLLGTDPNFDPSEMYTFTLRYDNNNKRLDYDLYYVNRTCI